MEQASMRSGHDHAGFYSGIRNGLWEPRHERRMGKAVWLFGWLVSRETPQNGSTGLVLGGKVLTWKWVAAESGWPERTLQRWAQVLRRGNYIEIIRAQHGFIVRIRNAKKFAPRQPAFFPGTPEVARLAGNGDARSGEPGDKSGEPRVCNRLMKSYRKSKGEHPLFQKLLAYAYQAYWERRGHRPSWMGEDFKFLSELLAANPTLTEAEFQKVFGNYLASDKLFYRQKGWRLKYACEDFDGLRDGPTLARESPYEAARRETAVGRHQPSPSPAAPTAPKAKIRATEAQRRLGSTLWTEMKQFLAARLKPQIFSTWFAPTRGLCMLDRELLVEVHNEVFARWFQGDGAKFIADGLRELAPKVEVRYLARDSYELDEPTPPVAGRCGDEGVVEMGGRALRFGVGAADEPRP